MQHLKYILFTISEGNEEKARSVLMEYGVEPPIEFDYVDSPYLPTSYTIYLPENGPAEKFIKRIIKEGIDDKPFNRPERRYTKKEIQTASLFWIHPRQRDDGYNVYGTEFSKEDVCPKCGAGEVQKSDLVIKCSKYKGIHFGATYNFELIVSASLAQAIKHLSGFRLAPVIDYKSRKVSDELFQLIPIELFPTLVPPTRFIKSELMGKMLYCETCGKNGLFLESEMHIASPPERKCDTYHTIEIFGEKRQRGCPTPETVFSNELVKIIKEFDKGRFE